MVALKVFAALFALSSVALAHFEPLDERAMGTIPEYQELDARDMFPSHVVRSTEGHSIARPHLSRRGVNSFYSSSYSKVVGSLAGEISSLKKEVSKTCSSKSKTSTSTFKASIHQHLSKCKQQVHQSCGHAHDIPHKPQPSKYPSNPPSVPGCAGQVSAVVIDINEMLDEIKTAVKGNKELESLVAGYSTGIDVEVADLVASGNTLLSGLSSYTQKYTAGYSTSLAKNGFRNLLASF